MSKVVCRTSWPNTNYNIGKASDPELHESVKIKHNHRIHICLKMSPHIGEDHQCHKCLAEY